MEKKGGKRKFSLGKEYHFGNYLDIIQYTPVWKRKNRSNHAELNEGDTDIDIDAPAVLLPVLVEQVLHSQRQHNLQGYTIHQSWGYFLDSRSDPDPVTLLL